MQDSMQHLMWLRLGIMTADNFEGCLPSIIADAGFDCVEQANEFNSLFGTIRLLRAVRLTSVLEDK